MSEKLINKLVLGSVQFGTSYGISNLKGKVTVDEVYKILDFAKLKGICTIDTSPTYGDAEGVLENYSGLDKFEVITKFYPINKNPISMSDIVYVNDQLSISLSKFVRAAGRSVLVHSVDDLLGPESDLYISNILELKKRHGLKIGISAYSEKVLEQILVKYKPDFVQLPLNIFDQRLIATGFLKKLKKSGIEIHTRSCFLQGLIFLDPLKLSEYFKPIRNHLLNYHQFVHENHLNLLDVALSYVLSIEEVDKIVIGVTSAEELNQILNFKTIKEINFKQWAIEDERFVNPALWPK